MPHLVLVGKGDALAAVAVAVFLDEATDELDGIAGVVAAHEGDTLQFLNHEHAFVVDEGVGTGEGGLTDGQLFLVEAWIGRVEIGVGVRHLWDFAH